MKLMDLNKKAETVPQPIFYVDGIPYLPSYSSRHLWIGPGAPNKRKEYTTAELVAPGSIARLSVMMLWKRSWTDDIRGWKML